MVFTGRWFPNLLLLVCLGYLGAGCRQTISQPASTASPTAQKARIVTTVFPTYLLTKAVVGDAAEVSLLIPPGTEVHDYQAKPAEVRTIAEADILVQNGLGLEAFLDDTIKNAQNPKLRVITASQNLPTANLIQEPSTPGESTANPHVWLDPVLAQQQVETIQQGLGQADPSNRAVYQANAKAYQQKLEALHRQFQTGLRSASGCTFIAFHDAYPYLAQRYQLRQVAVVEVPEDSVAPVTLQKIMQTAKQFQVKALLKEPGQENKVLQNLAQDLKVPLQSLDPLEAGMPEPQHYFTAMTNNLKALESVCQ